MGLFGKSGLQGLPTRVALPLRDIQLRLSQWGYWGPPIHNMGLCSRPREDPNAWKQFGPEPTWAIEPRYRPDFGHWGINVSEHVTTRFGLWSPARPRDVHMQVGAGQDGGHHTGCTRLAPTMQAAWATMDSGWRTTGGGVRVGRPFGARRRSPVRPAASFCLMRAGGLT